MKFASVKETSEVLAQKGLNAKTLSSYFAQIVEHPLNHGKRLGIIRLSHDVFMQKSAMIQIEEQLNDWQSNCKILAIWFEVNEQPRSLSHYGWLENEAIRNHLLEKIKYFSKPSILWCDQGLTASKILFNQVSYCLVKTDARYPFIGYKPKHGWAESSFLLNHHLGCSNMLRRDTHTYVLPIIDSRSRLLERLSSQPWQKQVCLNLSAKMKEIFLQAKVNETGPVSFIE